MRRWSLLLAWVFVLGFAVAASAQDATPPAQQETLPATTALTAAGAQPLDPFLNVDKRNVLHAFWWENDPNGRVEHRSQAPGGSWGAAEELSAGQEGVVVNSLQVVSNRDGEACAFWVGLPGIGLNLYMACTGPGGMTPAQVVEPANGSSREFIPAFTPAGSVVTVHLQGAGDVLFGDQPLNETGTLAGWHDFIIAPDGRYYVAWLQLAAGTGESNQVFVRTSGDGGQTWTPQEALATPETAPTGGYISLAADAQSRVNIAWIGGGSVYLRRDDGGRWGPVTEVNAGQGGVTGTGVALIVDAAGATHVAWEGSFVRYRVQRADGTWSDGQVIGRGASTGTGPALAVRANGVRDFLWRDDASAAGLLQYVSLAPNALPAVAPPAAAAPATTVAVGDNFQSLPGIPLPNQISTDPKVVAVNLLLALLSSVYFGFVTSVFNGILGGHTKEIGTWLQRLTPAKLRRAAPADGQPGPWWHALLFWLGIIVITSLIQSLLDPSPLLSEARLHVFLAITAAALIAALVEKLSEVGVRTRLHAGRALRAEAYGYGIALALVSVLFSRLMGFQPGYVVGIIGVLSLLPEIPDGPQAGERALGVLGSLLVFGLLCWVLAIPLAAAPDLQALALSVFVICLQGVTFALIPLSIFDGSAIWQWRKGYWMAFFAITAFLFYHILINPSMSDIGALQQNGLRTLLIVMAVFGLATLVLWIVLPFRIWLRERSHSGGRNTPSTSG